MKIKKMLYTLADLGVISLENGLNAKQLKLIEPYFDTIDELKGKDIEIVEKNSTTENINIEITEDGFSFNDESEPKLINLKELDSINGKIYMHSIFLLNDEAVFRCQEDVKWSLNIGEV